MNQLRSILFRVDAGPQHGLGHLQRCLSLAAALRRGHGIASVFLTQGESEVQAHIRACGGEMETLERVTPWSADDARHTAARLAQHRGAAVIVDSYDVSDVYLQSLRQIPVQIILIDDGGRCPSSCHVVVNGGAHARQLPYRSAMPSTRLLLGPSYAMLREEFWDMSPRAARPSVERVLVMLGGADLSGLMPSVLSRLNALPETFAITAVIGPFAANHAAVGQVAQASRHPVTIVEAPCTVRSLMESADLAISAAGQTLYELACAGCPTIAVAVAENQREQLRALSELGLVQSVEPVAGQPVVEAIGAWVGRLLLDAQRRQQMSQVGQHLIDGNGARRVAEGIANALQSSPTAQLLTSSS